MKSPVNDGMKEGNRRGVAEEGANDAVAGSQLSIFNRV